MKSKHVKMLLSSAIAEVAGTPEDYCVNPNRDFTRTRKISLQKLISGIINMECKSLPNELIDMFKGAEDMPSVSAFVQQRDKLKPEAFEAVFNKFISKFSGSITYPTIELNLSGGFRFVCLSCSEHMKRG